MTGAERRHAQGEAHVLRFACPSHGICEGYAGQVNPYKIRRRRLNRCGAIYNGCRCAVGSRGLFLTR